MKLSVLSKAGKAEGEIELNRPEVSPTLLREWYERARANARTGTAHTKLRNEVSGGGKKPWRQKGTGRARQGSTRAPHWRKGGVVFGPRNERDYSQEMPQQKRRTAAQLMFSDLAESGRLVVHTGLGDTLKTKEAVATLKALGVDELHRVVVIVDNMNADNLRGFRNLAGVALENATRLDPRLLASARKVVVSKDVLEALFAAEGGSRASA